MALGSVLGVAIVLISLLDGWLYFTIWYVMCGLYGQLEKAFRSDQQRTYYDK